MGAFVNICNLTLSNVPKECVAPASVLDKNISRTMYIFNLINTYINIKQVITMTSSIINFHNKIFLNHKISVNQLADLEDKTLMEKCRYKWRLFYDR